VRLSAVHEFSAWTEDGGAAPDIICGGGVSVDVVFVCLPVGASGASQAPGTESTRTSSPRLYEQSVGQDHARESEY
jgi:hypothetical protein